MSNQLEKKWKMFYGLGRSTGLWFRDSNPPKMESQVNKTKEIGMDTRSGKEKATFVYRFRVPFGSLC